MEVLMYGDIYDSSAAEFINQIESNEDSDLTIRINSDGGSPEFAWGMVAKYREFEGEKIVKIDGKAMSSAAFFLLYADAVNALDVTQIMFHRAAFPEWYEQNYMTEANKGYLMSINKELEKALRAKIDIEAFEKMKGVTIKEIFSMDSRVDVFLTAQEAKKIGLVSKIIKITPDRKQKIDSKMLEISAKFVSKDVSANNISNNNNQKIETKMTIEKLKAEHPELFAQVVAMGVSSERDRVTAWSVFAEIDPKAVAEGIKGGENISQTAMAEFTLKKLSATSVEKITTEGAPAVETSKADGLTPEPTELEKLEAKLNAELGLK
jgi:ATP-dependent protease ClpP protease subunit